MCGFIGKFEKTGRRSVGGLKSLAHRGPDASGEWTSPDGCCWLGHVRLSILELSEAGSQPMTSASGRSVIVFNGEIYNHLEVRERLEGIRWRGHSDTETLLEVWENLGSACLDLFRGMFAFALYDCGSSTLHLVRDRLGIKPLYFLKNACGGIAFASEVRALLGGRRPSLSADALASYLATGHTPCRGEIGEGICILPTGTHLCIGSDGTESSRKWWPGENTNLALMPKSLQDMRSAVRSHVESAIAEHLLADVPVASFLSGGIDSSIVSLVAARVHSEPLRTFCIGFPNTGFDERAIARVVADQAGSLHTEIEVRPEECQQWVVEAVDAMDVPSVDAINSYIVSKAVRQSNLKVALSGLGGDELFGGYPSFSDIPRLAFLQKIPPSLARSLVRWMPAGVREKLEGAASFDPFSLALLRRRWWSAPSLQFAGLSGDIIWPERNERFLDCFQAISWAEILGYMEPMLLRDSDQMSMAVSLELRVPLLDHRLVEFVLSLPHKWKCGHPPKRLLIEAFQDILPDQVWNRTKQGFTLPMDDWMRAPLKSFCRHGLESAGKLLDRRFIDCAAKRFEARKLHWTRLWQLVVLGHYTDKQPI